MVRKKRSSMGKLADETARQVDQMLSDDELELIKNTSINWESLKPKITNSETYTSLINAVQQSTKKNEDLAQLRARIENLGKDALKAARTLITNIKP
ncbi:hypothetical protein TRIP_C20007 [Candidatus Zixiibacteriota bacterium]|nr:hypothetical protein TRIP_C20007 [candidate division Zixibacteria bacterium]